MKTEYATITYELPIDWHCRECGHTHQGLGFSYPVRCPVCKAENSISHGWRRLPKNSWSVDSEPMNYNLAGTDKTFQYYFRCADGSHIGATIDEGDLLDQYEEWEAEDALAEFIRIYKKRFWISSRLKELPEMLIKMEAKREASYASWLAEREMRARKKIHDTARELASIRIELDESE